MWKEHPMKGNHATRSQNGSGANLSLASLERRTRSNWYMLVGISLVSTLGMAATLFFILRRRFETPWPWVNTDLVLIGALTVAISAYVIYLTTQMKTISVLLGKLQAMERERTERARQQHERLMALLNISRIMGTETNTQAVFDAITQTCRDTFECDRVSLMLVDSSTQELVVQSATGNPDISRALGTREPLGKGIAGLVAQQGEPRILAPEDMEDLPATKTEGKRLCEAMVVPIFVRGELVGVLNVGSTLPEVHFGEDDLQSLQVFAENAGSCIRHAEQADWMRQTIQALQAANRSRAQGARSSA
jgi:transcriptional regulator with GAF, ATPase, and Fis domain